MTAPSPAAPVPTHPGRGLPPLLDLPSPPRLPREDTSLAPPGEILAESRRALVRRLLRVGWVPALRIALVGLALTLLFAWGAAPTYWLFVPLAFGFDPIGWRTALAALGIDRELLWAACLLVPLVLVGLSALLLPLAAAAIAPLNPRRFLSEAAFQRTLSHRLAAVLMAPSLLLVLAVPLAVALRAPIPWTTLGPGQLMAVCLALLVLLECWYGIARWLSAARVLDIPAAAALESTARIDPDPERRHRAAVQVLAQDRRHLPPAPGSPEASGALTPGGMLRGLAALGRAAVLRVGLPMALIGWFVLGIADAALLFGSAAALELTDVPSALNLAVVVLGLPIAVLALMALALTPALAVRCAAPQRSQVIDQRTYPSWPVRARVNPWEAALARWNGLLAAAVVVLAVVAYGVGLSVLGAQTGLTWTWLVLDVLVLAPLVGVAAAAAMRAGARDLLYGPPGDYMRRPSPAMLVAPEIGTRTERGTDPAVRAALRQRLRAEHGEHALELIDLDAQAGERLWVDGSLPGARDTEVREADVVTGRLPDFGADASPFAAPEQGATATGRHEIPGSVRGLGER